MPFKTFLLNQLLVFLVVFLCLPLPHGNIYPFIGMCLVCLCQCKKLGFNTKNLNPLLILLVVWALLGTLWAVDTIKSLQMCGKVMAILLGGWLWWSQYQQFNRHKWQNLQTTVFIAGALLALCLLVFGIDLQFNGRLYKVIDQHLSQALVHGCIACSLAIWIGLPHLRSWMQAVMLILLFWTVQRCSSDAAALGILLGSATLVMHKIVPQFLRIMFIYGMPVVWGGLPLVFLLITPQQYTQWVAFSDPSYTHRLFIWHSVAKQIFDRFWTGFGFGSSRYRSLVVEGGDITILHGQEKLVLFSPENCLHPHNFMLQIWLELGAIGVILACVTWIFYWRKHYHNAASYVIAFWGSALCVAATGISVWQSWWLILLATLMPIYSKQSGRTD